MKQKIRLTIRVKTIIMILVFALLLGGVAMFYFSISVSNSNNKYYDRIAENLSNTVSEVVNVEDTKTLKEQVKAIVDNSPTKPLSDEWGSDEWNEYIAQFDEIAASDVFIRLRDNLRTIADANTDVDCIYLSYMDVENEFFVYIVDSAPEDEACPPGCLDPIYDFNKHILTEPEKGFPPYRTNTEEYGWLVTSGSAIFNGDEVVAYAMVDISMTTVRNAQRDSIMTFFIYLVSTIVLISIIGIVVVHFILVRPIRRINKAAKLYGSTDLDQPHDAFANLSVNTRDELQDLSITMKKMEADVNNKLAEIQRVSGELAETQQEAEKMTVLANTDALTGVFNKIAYNSEVEELDKAISSGQNVEFGLAMIDLNYLKFINDEHGHDAGDAALISLTGIICSIFTHSRVFRIGGDEFVVLLNDYDYKRSMKLVEKFNAKIADLAKLRKDDADEHVSAAIGYSEFNKETDKCVDDVFKRADTNMYERKREMKHQ